MQKLRQKNQNCIFPPGLTIKRPKHCEKPNSSVEFNQNDQKQNDPHQNNADQNSRNKKKTANKPHLSTTSKRSVSIQKSKTQTDSSKRAATAPRVISNSKMSCISPPGFQRACQTQMQKQPCAEFRKNQIKSCDKETKEVDAAGQEANELDNCPKDPTNAASKGKHSALYSSTCNLTNLDKGS